MTSYVLVHGGFHGSWCWPDTAARLRELGHRVGTVDLPGRGDTAHLAATVTLDDWVAALDLLVDAAPEHPIFVAHSIGAATVNQYAELHANKVAQIVYICAVTPRDGDNGSSTMLEAGPDSVFLRDGAFTPGPTRPQSSTKTARSKPSTSRAVNPIPSTRSPI